MLFHRLRHTLAVMQLTTREAAERAGVAQVTIQQNISRGNLVAQKMGRDWFIGEDELRRWMKERQEEKPKRGNEPGKMAPHGLGWGPVFETRQELNLSQKELAARLGFSIGQVVRAERVGRDFRRLAHRNARRALLGLPPEEAPPKPKKKRLLPCPW